MHYRNPKKEKRQKIPKILFKELMVENFSNLGKEI